MGGGGYGGGIILLRDGRVNGYLGAKGKAELLCM